MLEKPALGGQAIEIGRRIDRVAVGPDGAGAQRFKHDKHHVRWSRARYFVGLWCLVAYEVHSMWIGLINAQVVGHDRIVLAHLCFVIARLTDLDRVVEEDHGVQAQRSDLVVAREEGIAPAQWDGVFQVDVFDAAQNTQ
ncbi:hypothetical protein D3C85_613570 [compost metagenome]